MRRSVDMIDRTVHAGRCTSIHWSHMHTNTCGDNGVLVTMAIESPKVCY